MLHTLFTRARVEQVVATTSFVRGREQIFAQSHNHWMRCVSAIRSQILLERFQHPQILNNNVQWLEVVGN